MRVQYSFRHDFIAFKDLLPSDQAYLKDALQMGKQYQVELNDQGELWLRPTNNHCLAVQLIEDALRTIPPKEVCPRRLIEDEEKSD